MKAELTVIPSVSIHPNKVNFYYEYHWHPCRPSRGDTTGNYSAYVQEDGTLVEWKNNKIKHIIGSDRKANGRVSKQAKRKITRSIDYILAVTPEKKVTNRITGRTFKMKIAFITLTLPSQQIHTDKEIISKALNQFLIEIKRYHKVDNYIWRAEKQKNGNIHFHILIDRFIDYQELRDRWNRIIEKLGYVTRYRESQQEWHKNGFRVREELLKTWPLEKQKKVYIRGAKTHWNSPNTTDIHKLKKIINIKAYITKYMTKNEDDNQQNNSESVEKPKQTGRIWGCSQKLSDIKGARLAVDTQTENELKKLEEDKTIYRYQSDYYTSYYIDFEKLPEKGCDYLFRQLALYLYETFGRPYQMKI